jgi:hypothetical protein
MNQLISSTKFTPAVTVTAGAAGTTDITGTVIDTASFGGVAFIVQLGAIVAGAVTSIKVQECDTSGGTYTDVSGLSLTIADTDDEDIRVLDYRRPKKRYVLLFVDRGTQNATVSAVAALYNSREQVVAQVASTTVVAGVSG